MERDEKPLLNLVRMWGGTNPATSLLSFPNVKLSFGDFGGPADDSINAVAMAMVTTAFPEIFGETKWYSLDMKQHMA